MEQLMVAKACWMGGKVKGGKSRLKVERVEKLMVARACLKGGRVKGGIVISGPEPSKIDAPKSSPEASKTPFLRDI